MPVKEEGKTKQEVAALSVAPLEILNDLRIYLLLNQFIVVVPEITLICGATVFVFPEGHILSACHSSGETIDLFISSIAFAE